MTRPNFEPVKGARDWYGSQTIIRNKIRAILQDVFERYGYDRLETPIMEARAVLAFKGGGEIQKEVFQLKDQGGRDLALRFDQTVPFARYLASNPEVKFPFKRYAIGEVFRDGPAQPEQGRYKGFTQCDVDIAGVKEMTAEAELFALAQDAFRELGLGEVEVNINNRKLLDGILDFAQVPTAARIRTITALDKLDKIGVEGLEKELQDLRLYDDEKQLSNETLKTLFAVYDQPELENVQSYEPQVRAEIGERASQEIMRLFKTITDRSELYQAVANLKTKGELLLPSSSADKLLDLVKSTSDTTSDNERTFGVLSTLVTSESGIQGLSEVRILLDYATAMGFDSVRLNPALARGLNYYTGTTIEVFLKNRALVPSAILAGGRFDDMIGDFRGVEEQIPAVGFSFGLERLARIIEEKEKIPATVRQLYIIPIGPTQSDCLRIAHELREQKLKVDMALQKIKVGKAVEFASKQGIPFVAFVGEDEVASGQLAVKNLNTGEQRNIKIPEANARIAEWQAQTH
jgi:histidyl-tRNA synthetase